MLLRAVRQHISHLPSIQRDPLIEAFFGQSYESQLRRLASLPRLPYLLESATMFR